MTLSDYLNTFVNKSVAIRIFIDNIESNAGNVDENLAKKQVEKALTNFSNGVLIVHIFLNSQI